MQYNDQNKDRNQVVGIMGNGQVYQAIKLSITDPPRGNSSAPNLHHKHLETMPGNIF